LIHGGKIGFFHEDNSAVARMLPEIFLDGFLGFADIDGEKDEAFGGELAPILSTKAASSAQKPHQVVQNSRRTTLPPMELLVNLFDSRTAGPPPATATAQWTDALPPHWVENNGSGEIVLITTELEDRA
jgi:hypothetical protein